VEHQRLIDYITKEALKRNLTIPEFARAIGFSENHMGNIMRGSQPGLDVCKRLARALSLKTSEVLYMAGHLTEDDLNSPSEIPADLLPLLRQVAQMKGTPFFDAAVEIIETSLDSVIKLFRKAA
jgi:transcriptional regulator with XRE-family HTH domain